MKDQQYGNLSLDQKINKSQSIIKEALQEFSLEKFSLAWTGGKDSTTMLWLFRSACSQLGAPVPRVMFIDEGDVFEEIIDLLNRVREEWELDVTFVKNTDVSEKAQKIGDVIKVADLNDLNRREIEKIGFSQDTFAFEPESFIGNHLMKTVAMNSYLMENKIEALATAIRWDEQEARTKENYFSRRTTPDHTRVHPILHFSEKDIWDAIHTYQIPYCTLYTKGYRSLGAKSSTTKISDVPAWEQDLGNTSERVGRGQDKEKIMEQLRELGYM
jgi:phosphoadenosine phosphosulfate reductase